MKLHPAEPPRVELAQLPSPVVELKQLAQLLGTSRLLMKRDDLTGLELSGNKIRKLEYVVAEAIAQGADTLITHGGVQSNHCRATAALAARLGLRLRLILRSPESKPEREGNLFLDQLFGAECSYHSVDEYNSQLNDLVATARREEEAAGHKPYFFPVGASIPLGCWGYIRCIAELVEQLGRETLVDIYCATSSGGTQAGLILGRALFNCPNWSIRGVPVSDSSEYFRHKLRELINATITQYELNLSEADTPIELVDGFIGAGYAIPTAAGIEAIRLLGRTEGIALDPSYTSKAMAGMLADRKSRDPERVTVFIHTGGIFGLFARRDLFA
jgi:D-cysteine desulfhydrase